MKKNIYLALFVATALSFAGNAKAQLYYVAGEMNGWNVQVEGVFADLS